MKKVALRILILCMAICSVLFVFTACGGGTNIELSFIVDNEIVQTVKTTGNELIEIPEDPEKTGYTFDGWYWDKGVWATPFTANSLLNAPISKNMSIYAKFKAIEYTATFIADGSEVGTATFTIEDSVIANIPEVPEKTGHTGVWDQYTITTDNITINAIYTINKYTVIWQNYDGTVLETDENVEHGTVPEYNGETPERPADAQYTYTFDKFEPVISELTGNITYTATYSTTINKYTVIWKDFDGTVLETDENVPYGQMPEYNGLAPEKAGDQQYSYVFENVWSPAVETVKGNAEYTVQFTQVTNQYTITFYDEDKTTVLGTATADYGTNATYPKTTPVKAQDNGYTYAFDKWLKVDNTEDDLSNVIEDRDVYVSFVATPRVYNVYYIENGGNNIADTTYTYGVGLSVLPDESVIAKEGYAFEGWEDAQGNVLTAISTESYGDITLYAQWQTITYYASFYADGVLVDTKPFTVEDTIIADIPVVPDKTGYDKEWEEYTIIADDITVNAVYTPIDYTITYVNVKSATNNNATVYTIESNRIILVDLEDIDGYTFNCWLDEYENEITEIPAGSFVNRTITAKWNIVEFNIVYSNIKTATNDNVTKYTIESETITLINLANIDGYNFNCWLDENGNKITEIPSGGFGNREITARWDIVEYPVTFVNVKSATNNNATVYTIESEKITLVNLANIDGYNFNCWLDENEKQITEIPVGSFGDRTKWDTVEFNIAYSNVKTATNNNVTKYTIESKTITLINLANIDGYNFNCWLDENEKQITEIPVGSFGDRTKWDTVEFNIVYTNIKTAINNNVTKYTIESAKIMLTDLDNIDGYTFNCWLDENKNEITEIPAGSFGNREITAKWDLVEFDLILNYESERGDYAEGAANPSKYTIESDITLTELICNNTGYTFIGWFTEKNNGTGIKVEKIEKGSIGNISLYAQWDLENYTITYYNINGATNTNLKNYTVETETFTIDVLSKTGYTFDGWFNADETVANTTITKGSIGNKTFYAKWTAIEYDIDYILYGGTYVGETNPSKYTIEDSISFSELTKDGYRFDGWFDATTGGNKLTGITVGTYGNKTVYAHWTYISTISYSSNGGSVVSSTVNPAGTSISAPESPTKDYYEFVGWYDETLTNKYIFNTQPNEDITLYAKWQPVKYNITYVLNGGMNGTNPAQYTVEQKVELKAASKTGYTFVGWFTDEQFTSAVVEEITLGSHGEIVLYANYSINQYTISFETNDGTTIAAITQNYATSVTAPANPAKNGYAFSGWYSDSALKNAYTFSTIPANNITVYAKWALINYDITYNINGGTNGSNPAKYTITSSDITLKNPTKTGYEFKGWYTDSNYQNAITVITNGSFGNLELFAKWDIITYTVTYVLPDGATHTNPTSYTIETATVSLTDAEKTGYTFIGWFNQATGGNKITTFAGGSIGNLTIYGRFTVNDYTVWLDGSEEATYTVEFNLNGKVGTAPATQTITESNTLKYPTNPYCDGYIFAGWFDNENCEGKAFDFAAVVNKNTVLYAKWIATEDNNVIEMNGTATVTLNGTTDVVYMFVPLNSGNVTITTTGSYDTFGALYNDQGVKLVQDDDTGTDSNFQIVYNVTANKAYYIKVRAYSSAITGTCTLYLSGNNTIADGGYTVTSSRTTVTFDSDFTLAVPEARDGYKFLGWEDENGVLYTDGTGASVKTWDKAETTVLYSKWERTVYTINFVTNGGSAVDSVTFAFGDRIDLNDYVTTLVNKSFLGWYASNTDTERYNATYMPDHNLTLYAKWTNYALGEIKYNADKVAIKETDELTAELFGAVCLDTDGNFATITVTLSGTQAAGETISIRLVATNNGKTKQKTVSGIRVYGIPTLTFDNTVDYVNLKDGLTAEWFRAIGTDSFGESTEIRFWAHVKLYDGVSNIGRQVATNFMGDAYLPIAQYGVYGGEYIMVNIYAVDAAGNEKMLSTGDLKVYDLPVITYNEEKTTISVNDTINAELFNATAKDSFGENLTVSVMVYNGTISAGNTITVRLSAIDSKGNTQIIDRQIKVYGMPTIDNATTLDFKVEDEITVNSLGLTAKDTYYNALEISLTVKSGTQTAGSTMVFTATVTDIAGNVTTKDISVNIYGTPKITYNRNALKLGEDPLKQYAVLSFNLNGGNEIIENQIINDTIGMKYPEIPTRDGYAFSGWYTTVSCTELFDFSDKITDNTTIYAGWVAMVTNNYQSRTYIDARNYNSSEKPYVLLNAGSTSKYNYTYFTILTSGTCMIYFKNPANYGTNIYVYNLTKKSVIKNVSFSGGISIIVDDINIGDVIYVRDNAVYYNQNLAPSLYITGISSPNDGGTINSSDNLKSYFIKQYLSVISKDSFGNDLLIKATIKSGELLGGNDVIYTLTAIDKVGNVATVDTAPIPVYDINDIKFNDNVNYFSGATDAIKLDSKGEEFYANITDTFGGLCDITIEPAAGYTLKAGNTINIYLVATDKAGNSVRSELINGIKVYGTPTYIMNQDVVYETTDIDFVFTVYDSFGEELYYDISVTGEQVEGNTVSVHIVSEDDYGNILDTILDVYIGEYIFELTNGNSECKLVRYIGDDESVVIPNNINGVPVTSLGENVFNNCTFIQKAVVPDCVTSIGEGAFNGCSSLQEITIPFVGGSKSDAIASSSTLFGYIFGTNSFIGSTETRQYYTYNSSIIYYIPSTLTKVTVTGGDLFYGAFYGCRLLNNIVLPESIKIIDDYVFCGCSSLIRIEIPNGVQTITVSAFNYCNKLEYISIPDSINIIRQYDVNPGYKAFSNCPLEYNIYSNGYYLGNNNNPYLILVKCGTGTSCNVHNNTKIICDNAFYNCSNLTNVVIGNNVTSIGRCAFDSCTSLTNITIPDNVTSIGQSAFSCCSGLTSITIGNGITSYIAGILYGCSSLQEITIPFVGIDKYATTRSYNTLFGCIFGTSEYSGGVKTQQWFNVASASGYCYYYIPQYLTKVTVTGGNLLYGAFSNCSSLTSITIPDSVTSIGNHTFDGCSSLTSITIPNSVRIIEDYAFRDCKRLNNIILSDNIVIIGNYAFSECTSLSNITLGESVTSIGDYAFYYCDITRITIPNSVTSIGYEAFWHSGLQAATFNDTSGWQVSTSSNMSNATLLSSSSLSNKTTAGKYLASTYRTYYWKRG